MAPQQPPFGIDDASLVYNAEILRRALTTLSSSGVVTAGDLAVSAAGIPDHTVIVAAGEVWMPGTGSVGGGPVIRGQGSYYGFNDNPYVVDLLGPHPAHATLPRHDLIVAAVRDTNYDSSGNIDWVIQQVVGTPNAVPVNPTQPPSSVLLAQVTIPPASTTVTAANILDMRSTIGTLFGLQGVVVKDSVGTVLSSGPNSDTVLAAHPGHSLSLSDGVENVLYASSTGNTGLSTTVGHNVILSNPSGNVFYGGASDTYVLAIPGSQVVLSTSGGNIFYGGPSNDTVVAATAGHRIQLQSAGMSLNTPIAGDPWIRTYPDTTVGYYTNFAMRAGPTQMNEWPAIGGGHAQFCHTSFGGSNTFGYLQRYDGACFISGTGVTLRGNGGIDYMYAGNVGGISGIQFPGLPVLAGPTAIVPASNQLGKASSSIRYKTDAQSLPETGVDNPIWDLKPTRFKWHEELVGNGAEVNAQHPEGFAGLIAEEVVEVMPDAVHLEEDGTPAGVDALVLIGYLVDSIQFLKKKVDDLEMELEKKK